MRGALGLHGDTCPHYCLQHLQGTSQQGDGGHEQDEEHMEGSWGVVVAVGPQRSCLWVMFDGLHLLGGQEWAWWEAWSCDCLGHCSSP